MLEGSGQKSQWISGAPPLSFKAQAAGTLENYRIYGNTVNGESVGDRTGNLFDGEFLQGYWSLSDGAFMVSGKWICTQKMPCEANTDYTFTFGIISRWYGIAWYDIDGNYIEFVSNNIKSQPTIFTATSPANAAFMGIDIAGDSVGATYLDIHPSDVTDFMLVEGSTPLPYEPYGYKVPVTISNGTDTQTIPIYLPEQISKVGDEAEYIDYGEQKMHRIGADDLDVTLPALPTLLGTNVLSVGTAVQPSEIEVKGKIKAL